MSDIDYRPLGIERYVQVLRRRWRLIGAIALSGLLVAGIYLLAVGQSFTATTDVNINVISTDPFNAQRSASGLLDGTTEAQIATSNVVATQAAESLDNPVSPADLRRNLDVSVVADATIIRVSYRAQSENEARAGADAVAASYLAYRASQAQTRLGGVIDRIDTRLADLRIELGDANARAAAAESGSSDANQAASDRDLVVIEIDALLSQKNSLDLIDTAGGDILSSAVDNTVAVDPSRTLVLAIGLLVGLVAGIVAAFVVAALSRRLRTREDVERITGVRPLLEITATSANIPESGNVLSEFRVARERLFATIDPQGAVIAVLDDSPLGFPSDLPLNLALVSANSGQKTLILLPGLTEDAAAVLRDRLALKVVDTSAGLSLHESSLDKNLTVVFPDELRAKDVDNFDFSEPLRHLVTTPSGSLIFVVLPPKAPHSVELATARVASAVVAVLRLGTSRSDVLTATLEEFAFLSTPFVGALVAPKDRQLTSEPIVDPGADVVNEAAPGVNTAEVSDIASVTSSAVVKDETSPGPGATPTPIVEPAEDAAQSKSEGRTASDASGDSADDIQIESREVGTGRSSSGQRRVYASSKKNQSPRTSPAGKDKSRRS